eukprot:g12456.t1.1.5e17418b g12456  g12456.t1 contig6:1958093-1959605(+)
MTRSNEVSMISAHDDNRSVARNKDEVFAVDVAITQTVHASTVKPDVEPEKSGDPNNNNTFLMDVSNESLSETERANTNSCANDAEKEENDDTDTKNETSKKLKRKLSLEIALVSGCGGGKKKIRTVEAFNDTLFPMLQEVGWTKESGEDEDEGATFFLPPGVSLNTQDDTSSTNSKSSPTKKYSGDEETWDCTCGYTNPGSRTRCKSCQGWKGGKRLPKAYYNRIRDVIERVLEKRNEAEAKAAEAFLSAVPDYVAEQFLPQPKQEKALVARPRRTRQRSADVDWKHERTHYPKATSRVGQEYQVDVLPDAGSYLAAVDDGCKAWYVIFVVGTVELNTIYSSILPYLCAKCTSTLSAMIKFGTKKRPSNLERLISCTLESSLT